MFKLVLLCDYSREPERRLLRGLSDFANTLGGWGYFQISGNLYKDAARCKEVAQRAKDIGANAVFGRWDGIDHSLASSLGIPIVLRTVDNDYPDLPMLSGEYREIGRMAARFFLRQHYEHFAVFGYKGLIWSQDRLQGFREELGANGNLYTMETELGTPDEGSIKTWLQSLPKMTGLFAVNDVLALKVAELCLEIGIDIPGEIALLGVDNDEFLCNIASPKISSIHLDFERQGYELGEAIWRMHREGAMQPVRIKVHPVEIRERESTLRDIPLSRRAIEMRFKKEMAPDTLLSYLLRLRIQAMCKLLETTDLPVNIAAEKAGFDDTLNVGRTFKRYTGKSPVAWRKEKALAAAHNSHADNKKH